ncbi:toxin VasX [Gilliamella sp. G0441]|uniref:toxin VasX n=1 Tax=Gilliamella sp. G0441 TaxID=3384760 RepID=UPI003D335DCF
MNKTENIAIENKNEASGNCLACGRRGIPVFLLRQAVIKMKGLKTDEANPDYQELANYTKNLNFKSRMPDEELIEYGYILRTLRNGYIYVMQQQGEDINSRMMQTYECVEGALRLRSHHQLTYTEPRPISKACKNYCHTIPAAFIHLQQDYTQAWVAYSAQPWSKTAVEDYLKEQDNQVLSRFTKIDITNLAQSPAEATGNRAVPFTDIFGQVNNTKTPSKVLEFRFDDNKLPFFESAHPFNSFKQQKQQFATHVSNLYAKGKAISCGVVLEDTFGIAEELNTQRIVHLHIFNETPLTQNEISLAEQQIDSFESLEHATEIYEQRAKNMFKTINPDLQRQFNYYKPVMFKKRIILQLIEQYRSSIISAYNQEMARELRRIENFKNSGLDTVGYNGIPESTRMLTRVSRLGEEKREKLKDFDECIDQGKIEKFTIKLEEAYKEVVNYHKEWSIDYFTYARWLFGKDGFTSTFTETKPLSVNTNHFWQREFDFSSQETQVVYQSQVTNMLLDTTHSEIKLDEDSALWDELLSNSESIYYISEYNNVKGINRDETVYVDLENNQLLTPKDVVSNATNFLGTVYNASVKHKIETDTNQKIKILEKNKAELEIRIERNKQKIDELAQQKKQIPVSDPIAQNELRRQKQVYEKKLIDLKRNLEAINKELANIADPNSSSTFMAESGESLLNRTALKKQAILAKDIKRKPIESQWMRLNAFDELAKLGALPVEINVQIRPENIVKIQNLFTQMHRGFYNRGIYHPHELELLHSIEIDEQVTKTGTTKTKKVKFTLCFPDQASKTVFVDFINSTNGTLSPHNLKQFIEQNYKQYFQLIYKQKNLLENIDINEKGRATTADILEKTSDEAIAKAKADIEKQSSAATTAINQMEQKQDTIDSKIRVKTASKDVRIGQKTFKVNLAVSGILGTITLMNMSDMLKEWDEFKEGNGELDLRAQMVNSLISLILTGIDLTSQYKNIHLNMQLIKGINAGKDVASLDAKIRLNSMISKTVGVATAAITVLEAFGEIKSSFDMRNMEAKRYFVMRLVGAFMLGTGAIIAVMGSWITLIIGIALVIASKLMILFSKKYDNFTDIQHWLNRCCFGVQQEFDYLGYQAYHEDELYTHSGFGLALNDYAVMTYNIQTFVRLKPLYHPPGTSSEPGAPNLFQRHIYFYLDIPNFAKYHQNESATALIRIFINDYPNLKTEPDPIPEKYIDFKYRITSNKIELIAISKNYGNLNLIWTDKAAYFERYDRNRDILGRPMPDYYKLDEPDEFTLNLSTAGLTAEKQNDDTPLANELIINKWMAGTIGAINIPKYQIIIQYNNREDVPLIITKKNKIS